MNNRDAYNAWSKTYDSVLNKTRDLEAKALRECVEIKANSSVLEIGCGTGKNTVWLASKAKRLVGTDFSTEMLSKAREKITFENVDFQQLDLREDWNFVENSFDWITCSLVLEHIENLDFVFEQARRTLRSNGCFYIGELHPFKQYQGSKARFEFDSGEFVLECFIHHISDFFAAAVNNNFECVELEEWFDDDDKTSIPRVLTMIFRSKK